MNDVIKIIKSLEDSSVLVDGITETVKHEIKKKTRRQISWSFVSTFSCFFSVIYNFLIIRGISGREITRARRGYMNKNF